MNVDGLKTGHTSGAGFNLIASAVDGQRRLIAVIMGADSAKGREEEARKLLRWGQQNFTTVQILHRGKKVGTERIWYGDKENIAPNGTRVLDSATESRNSTYQSQIYP